MEVLSFLQFVMNWLAANIASMAMIVVLACMGSTVGGVLLWFSHGITAALLLIGISGGSIGFLAQVGHDAWVAVPSIMGGLVLAGYLWVVPIVKKGHWRVSLATHFFGFYPTQATPHGQT